MSRKRPSLVSVFCAMVMLLGLAPAARADVPLELVGQWNGAGVWLVAVAGKYAYVSDSYDLWVVDISNPAAPDMLGHCRPTPPYALPDVYINAVAASDGYAYLTSSWYDPETTIGGASVHVIDVSDPAAPVDVGGWMVWDCAMLDLVVSGGYLYVTEWFSGLHVYDISNPAQPQAVGSCELYDAYFLAVSGSYAYVTAHDGFYFDDVALYVIDVSNPPALRLVGRCATADADDVAVSGSYAYVAGPGAGVQVIDVSNPSAPLPTVGPRDRNGAWTDAGEDWWGWAYGLIEANSQAPGYAWTQWPVSEGGNGHWYARTAWKRSWLECRDQAMAAGGYLVTINDAAENAWLYQQFGTPGVARQQQWIGFNDIAVEGHWEWVGGDGGWWEQDNPASTSYVNWYPGTPEPNGGVNENAAAINYAQYDNTIGAASAVAVSGSYAYVAARSPGVELIDISNPAAPARVGGYDTSGDAFGVTVSGGYAYVADASGLLILRIGAEPRPGDLNCDGGVDFDDINPFVTALISQEGYELRYPDCRWLNGDIEGNGAVDFDDISPFVACLASGECP